MPIRALKVYRWTAAPVHTGSAVLGRVERGLERLNVYHERRLIGLRSFPVLPAYHSTPLWKNVGKVNRLGVVHVASGLLCNCCRGIHSAPWQCINYFVQGHLRGPEGGRLEDTLLIAHLVGIFTPIGHLTIVSASFGSTYTEDNVLHAFEASMSCAERSRECPVCVVLVA